jgi:hypothetical protein
MSDYIIKAVAIFFASAFVITSLSLFIVGLICTYTSNSVNLGKTQCENLYACGLILMAILISLALFILLERLFDYFEKGRQVSSISRPKPTGFRKNSPLSTIVKS